MHRFVSLKIAMLIRALLKPLRLNFFTLQATLLAL